jgi:DNA-binding PadR family transcriptional regulator
MDYDIEKLDEVVLALLHLTSFEEHGISRAWRSHDWGALDRLHEKGFISDARSKAKSVVLTDEGLEQSRALFQKHFGLP